MNSSIRGEKTCSRLCTTGLQQSWSFWSFRDLRILRIKYETVCHIGLNITQPHAKQIKMIKSSLLSFTIRVSLLLSF